MGLVRISCSTFLLSRKAGHVSLLCMDSHRVNCCPINCPVVYVVSGDRKQIPVRGIALYQPQSLASKPEHSPTAGLLNVWLIPGAEVRPPPRTTGLTPTHCPHCARVGAVVPTCTAQECRSLFCGAPGGPAESMCQWPIGAVTNDHRFDGLKQQPFYYLTAQ